MRSAAVRVKAQAMGAHPYAGRTAALATMHGKERVIAPAFAEAVGLALIVPPGLDTDAFGTFSGEAPRVGTMLEVAILKARAGMARAGVKIAVASEGTFAPHARIGILPAAIELMALVDDESGQVISESIVSLATNFDRVIVSPNDNTGAFLEQVQFPSHGIVVRPHAGGPAAAVWKGLVAEATVARAIELAAAISADGAAIVETDMRAHFNPTRMASLGELAWRLAARVARLCPQCGAPGYDVVERKAGLACLDCGTATSLVACEIVRCDSCGASEERAPPHGLLGAAPMHCPSCNP
jgi:hypothetical protein